MGTAWALSPQIIGFVRALRAEGLQVGPGDTQTALRALTSIPLARHEPFRLALRTVLVKNREAQPVFDRVFDDFWLALPLPQDTQQDEDQPGENEQASEQPGGAGRIAVPDTGQPDAHADLATNSGASATPRLMQRDFARIDADELAEMHELITLIARRLARRAGRRWRAGRRGRIDMRRTLRAAMGRGGELLDIKYHNRRPMRPNLTVVADVSYSMDAYCRFFLEFIYAFQGLFRRVESFVFSTQLSRVTDALRRGELAAAVDALADSITDWAGGTRIGESLQTLAADYGETALGRNTVVMIVSDGWDTGAPDALDAALRRVRTRCRRIIWLDPLLGHPRFFASAAGLHRASRWVDDCLPARDLDSLRELADSLGVL